MICPKRGLGPVLGDGARLGKQPQVTESFQKLLEGQGSLSPGEGRVGRGVCGISVGKGPDTSRLGPVTGGFDPWQEATDRCFAPSLPPSLKKSIKTFLKQKKNSPRVEDTG